MEKVEWKIRDNVSQKIRKQLSKYNGSYIYTHTDRRYTVWQGLGVATYIGNYTVHKDNILQRIL